MRRTLLALIVASTAATSCTVFGRMPPDGRPVADAAAAPELAIVEPSPLRAPKEVPVLSPPEVFAVYVPSHLDRERDLLVGEHWVFFKLSESEWFVEKRAAAVPRASGTAPAESLAPLRTLEGTERALTPVAPK